MSQQHDNFIEIGMMLCHCLRYGQSMFSKIIFIRNFNTQIICSQENKKKKN